MTTIFVREVMCFVEHDEVGGDITAAAQGVEELIAINLGGADYQRRFRVLFSIARQYADALSAKLVNKLLVFRVSECFQRRGVPCAPAAGQKPADLFAGDPRLAAAGR